MRPFEPLEPAAIPVIVDDAIDVLERIGIAFHDAASAELVLAGGGAAAGAGRVRIPADVVTRALAAAPRVVRLFDTSGTLTHEIGGDRQYFTPGSAAVSLLDGATGDARPPTTRDYVRYVQLAAALPLFASQSTAFVPADVPAPISDSYRLYLGLLHGTKPVVTGTFSAASCALMEDLLLAVRGTREELRAKPLAIYTCCPTSPLAWSADSAATFVACARSGIPVEIVPMPLSGFIAPVALSGTLTQLTAEALSGVVLAQLAREGAPVLFGCASTAFDVRHETTPLGSPEAALLACGAAQIGRHLGLPTQAYVGLSDAKLLDAQAGMETAYGAALGALGGINQIAGPGMLDFVNTFSLEKLVVDHEICAAATRLRARVSAPLGPVAPLIEELLREGHLLIAADTRRRFKTEISVPGAVIDRASRQRWAEEGRTTIGQRAAAEIERLLRAYHPPERPAEVNQALTARMSAEARRHGMPELPEAPCAA